MVLHAIPAGEAGHYSQRASTNRCGIARRVFSDQLGLAYLRVALVTPIHRSTVCQKMFGCGRYTRWLQWRACHQLTLQTNCHRPVIFGNQRRIRRIAFICAAPAQVPGHRQRGRKRPFNPAAGNFGCGGLTDTLDEVSIMSSAQPDVMRKDRSLWQVRMPMYRVNTK